MKFFPHDCLGRSSQRHLYVLYEISTSEYQTLTFVLDRSWLENFIYYTAVNEVPCPHRA